VTTFADQLLADLLSEYRPVLQRLPPPGGQAALPPLVLSPPVGAPPALPGAPPMTGRRWPAWLAPAAAAAGVALVVALAVILAGAIGRRAPAAPVVTGAGEPHYYVQASLCCGRPVAVIRSTATGRVTATVPVPGPVQPANGYGADLVTADRGGTFFILGFAPNSDGQLIYRFRLTRSGQVSGFSLVPGGALGNRQWQADAIAASPDGTQVAAAFYYAGPSNRPHPDYIVDVNTVTGAQTTWRGSAARLGPMVSVASLSWTGDSRELVFLGQWCQQASGAANSEACGAPVRRIAQVRALDPAAGGGRLDSGRLLLAQSARFPYLAQAVISPDGSAITAIDLTGPARGAHEVSGLLPRHLSVVRISVGTGRLLTLLYQRHLGPTAQFIGAPDCLILTQDVAGGDWLLDGGISGGAGYRNGFDGWLYGGRLVPLPPADGYVAAQAW
jgi:hypothetical protein